MHRWFGLVCALRSLLLLHVPIQTKVVWLCYACICLFILYLRARAYLIVKRRRPQSLPILQNGNFSHMRYPNNGKQRNVLCSSLVRSMPKTIVLLDARQMKRCTHAMISDNVNFHINQSLLPPPIPPSLQWDSY